jgi:hypothetical protein
LLPEPGLPTHPFVLRLATQLLGKAERVSRSGAVRLALDRQSAPELYEQSDAEQLQRWVMWLDDLCRTGWVTLVIGPPRDFASFTDRQPKLELRHFEALAAWAGYTPRALRWQQQWRDHLCAHWATLDASASASASASAPSHADRLALLDHLARSPLTALEGASPTEATRCLEALRQLCRSGRSMPLREASARIFHGRSKVLDNRDELLRLLGAAPGQLHEAPIQLLLAPPAATGGAPRFAEVLFIENLVTFERMADHRAPDWASSLLVFASGFRGSAKRLRTPQGCRLYWRGTGLPSSAGSQELVLQETERWLFGELQRPVFFFGDLDHAGMQILASLRASFPDAQAWAPGYAVLARALERGGGHAPEQAGKAFQLDPGLTGCTLADQHLLPLMRQKNRFMDQETFDPEAPQPDG